MISLLVETKKRLIVGVDDSNHAGDDRIKGEIDFAAFSFHPRDAEIKEFSNRRNYRAFIEWISDPGRDYRFIMLRSPKYRQSGKNLITTTPLLVESFINEGKYLIGQLEIYLDGVLRIHEKAQLINDIKRRTGIEKIITKGFIKKRKSDQGDTIKGYYCPAVVYKADTGASMFFSKPFEELVSDPKCVNQL